MTQNFRLYPTRTETIATKDNNKRGNKTNNNNYRTTRSLNNERPVNRGHLSETQYIKSQAEVRFTIHMIHHFKSKKRLRKYEDEFKKKKKRGRLKLG